MIVLILILVNALRLCPWLLPFENARHSWSLPTHTKTLLKVKIRIFHFIGFLWAVVNHILENDLVAPVVARKSRFIQLFYTWYDFGLFSITLSFILSEFFSHPHSYLFIFIHASFSLFLLIFPMSAQINTQTVLMALVDAGDWGSSEAKYKKKECR